MLPFIFGIMVFVLYFYGNVWVLYFHLDIFWPFWAMFWCPGFTWPGYDVVDYIYLFHTLELCFHCLEFKLVLRKAEDVDLKLNAAFVDNLIIYLSFFKGDIFYI